MVMMMQLSKGITLFFWVVVGRKCAHLSRTESNVQTWGKRLDWLLTDAFG